MLENIRKNLTVLFTAAALAPSLASATDFHTQENVDFMVALKSGLTRDQATRCVRQVCAISRAQGSGYCEVVSDALWHVGSQSHHLRSQPDPQSRMRTRYPGRADLRRKTKSRKIQLSTGTSPKNTKKWDKGFEQALLLAPDYRSFIRLFFISDSRWSEPKPLTFGEFAKRGGFASRGFMNDVLASRKRLSHESFFRVSRALKLSSAWSDYLRYLIALEEESFRARNQSRSNISSRLENLKRRLGRRRTSRRLGAEDLSSELTLCDGFPEVYASLGTEEEGATLDEIALRSKLQRQKILDLLERMERAGFIKRNSDKDRVFPIVTEIDHDEMTRAEIFRQDFFRSIEKASRRFDAQSASKEALFMAQTFSVSKKELPQLRRKLKELIESFANSAESPDGDCITEICLALSSNA